MPPLDYGRSKWETEANLTGERRDKRTHSSLQEGNYRLRLRREAAGSVYVPGEGQADGI